MNEAAAKRHVNGFREDLMWCASQIQNDPARFEQAIQSDPETYKELRRLTGDLFSLVEVIMGED